MKGNKAMSKKQNPWAETEAFIDCNLAIVEDTKKACTPDTPEAFTEMLDVLEQSLLLNRALLKNQKDTVVAKLVKIILK